MIRPMKFFSLSSGERELLEINIQKMIMEKITISWTKKKGKSCVCSKKF